MRSGASMAAPRVGFRGGGNAEASVARDHRTRFRRGRGAVAHADRRPSSAALAASGPSFDCSKAASADEQAVCANPYLARLDVLVARAYANFSPEFGDKRAIGKWLLQDRNACGADEACIAAVEVDALETYGGSAAWADSYAEGLIGAKADALSTSLSHSIDQALPKRIGDCAMTHIAELGTRFGDPLDGADPNAGTAVTFTNHGGQVSYELENSLYDAKVGDPVAMCLISIPRDCPKGDTRGRVYYGLDARTGGAWSLPDSQHMCGGA